MARPVTLAVPAMSPRIPYVGFVGDVGRQARLPKNSRTSNDPVIKPRPSFVMKTKMPIIKTIAEIPPTKTKKVTALSAYQSRPRWSRSIDVES